MPQRFRAFWTERLSDNTAAITESPLSGAPSTQGMTTKVVKGSMWTLAGQLLPFFVSLVATPFTIRFLGSEGYGVLLLVALIPGYFAFADFGMGTASTKYGAEAYGEGDPIKEGLVVRTASLVALFTALLVVVPLFIGSGWIVDQFRVPLEFHQQASSGLKIACLSFLFGILASVLNTPILARLRMDLSSLANAVPKVLMAILTPIVLYLGGSVVEAVWVAFFAALLSLTLVVVSSARLLPELFRASVSVELVSPLLRFGGGLVVGGVAAALLVNFEKLALSKLLSVEALAFYSVSFTLAGMTAMFSNAMLQSLGPAFARLNAPEKKREFDALFSRAMRLNLLLLPLAMALLFVVARPFFTIWAGESFGRESTTPFYILLVGLFFNILAYVPQSTITAKGRTDIFAKLYWIELFFYVFVAVFLIGTFGIIGAAAAYSLRVIVDALVMISLSKHIADVTFKVSDNLKSLLVGGATLLPSLLFAGLYDNFSLWLLIIVPLCSVGYVTVMWHLFLEPGEREWLTHRFKLLAPTTLKWIKRT